MPAWADVVNVNEAGFCAVELKPFGPLQLHPVAPVATPVNVRLEPKHIGLGEAVAVTPVGPEPTFNIPALLVVEPQALVITT